MQVGDLFTRSDIETRPCVHCGAPAVAVDHHLGKAIHFEVADNGAKTAQFECTTTDARGRRKPLGTTAEIAS